MSISEVTGAGVPGEDLLVEPRIARSNNKGISSSIPLRTKTRRPSPCVKPYSQLMNDTLMPDNRKQPTRDSRGGDNSEDGKLEQRRSVGDCLFRDVRY